MGTSQEKEDEESAALEDQEVAERNAEVAALYPEMEQAIYAAWRVIQSTPFDVPNNQLENYHKIRLMVEKLEELRET